MSFHIEVDEASLFLNLSFVTYEIGEGACPVYHSLLLLRLKFDVSIYIWKLDFVNHSDLQLINVLENIPRSFNMNEFLKNFIGVLWAKPMTLAGKQYLKCSFNINGFENASF